MKTALRTVAPLIVACICQASAQTSFALNLGGPDNVETIMNSMVFANNGVSATAKAWSISRTASNATLQTSQVVRWSPGIGVKNSSETITNVPYVPYYVDNEDHYDFVLFVFDRKVDVSTVRVTPSSGTFDTDVTYWFGNTSPSVSLTGSTLANLSSLGFGSAINSDTSPSNSARNISLSIPSTGVNAILIGARISGDSDFDRFKVATVSGVTVVPEPASMGLLAFGAAIAMLRRRR